MNIGFLIILIIRELIYSRVDMLLTINERKKRVEKLKKMNRKKKTKELIKNILDNENLIPRRIWREILWLLQNLRKDSVSCPVYSLPWPLG